jgi:chromosomal replication initiation ATPase DnaA
MSSMAEISARLDALEARVHLLSAEPPPRGCRSIALVIAAVAREFGVPPEQIASECRAPRTLRARHAAIRLARDVTQRSSGVLGRHFGRDHSTILHAIARAGEIMAQDPDFARRLAAARHSLDESSRA